MTNREFFRPASKVEPNGCRNGAGSLGPGARNGVWRAMDSLPASITATARRAR